MNYLDYTYVILTFLWYILYGISFLHIEDGHVYFETFSFYYQIYVCSLLIYYFSPYHNVNLTKVKKQMIFSAAIMLLFSIGIQNIYRTMSKHAIYLKEIITT